MSRSSALKSLKSVTAPIKRKRSSPGNGRSSPFFPGYRTRTGSRAGRFPPRKRCEIRNGGYGLNENHVHDILPVKGIPPLGGRPAGIRDEIDLRRPFPFMGLPHGPALPPLCPEAIRIPARSPRRDPAAAVRRAARPMCKSRSRSGARRCGSPASSAGP